MSIPGLEAWLASDAGRAVLDWVQKRTDHSVTDIFGFNALQIGFSQIDFLRASRIPLRQRVGDCGLADVIADLYALPFASSSIDLAILPHALEFSEEPHQILREVERILIPEGQVIIIGFNPYSLWGIKRQLDRSGDFPWNGSFLSPNRLKDWLKLLGFETGNTQLGCYLPPFERLNWLQRRPVHGQAGQGWWNVAGGVYILQAVKRTPGMRLITPNWRKKPVRAKALRPVTQKENHGH